MNTRHLNTDYTNEYQKLELLLSENRYGEADRFTKFLCPRIVDTSGFTIWNIDFKKLTSPIKGLKVVDSLWTHYSKGHFGFTTQMQIAADLGDTPCCTPPKITIPKITTYGKYTICTSSDTNGLIERFRQQVGWKGWRNEVVYRFLMYEENQHSLISCPILFEDQYSSIEEYPKGFFPISLYYYRSHFLGSPVLGYRLPWEVINFLRYFELDFTN